MNDRVLIGKGDTAQTLLARYANRRGLLGSLLKR